MTEIAAPAPVPTAPHPHADSGPLVRSGWTIRPDQALRWAAWATHGPAASAVDVSRGWVDAARRAASVGAMVLGAGAVGALAAHAIVAL